ncbi:disintegrin and metalloproteinase domain-containing protein 9 isoform X2 [Scleropages formosus]|nr:disintegrin and metalloproteinase domain-containing protein 9-like isoform X2 [Scleropages formosus]
MWKRHVDGVEEPEQETEKNSVRYSLSINGKPHLLHLEKNKDFLAKGFVQYSYDDNGNLITSYPGVHRECHYHGYVEGHEDSLVALSTCKGLRGVIFMGSDSYGIEPVIHSRTNEHFLFPLMRSEHEASICGVTNEMSHSDEHTLSMTKFFRKKRNLPQTRYIELALVVDKNRYDFKKGNMTAINEEMVTLANLMDGYYKELNIRVALVGLEVLSSGNPFNVTGSAGSVLGNFVNWRKTSLSPRIRNDVAQLVVGLPSSYPGGILGMAFVGTVCSASTSGGISVYSDNSLSYYSTIMAHEMGHNLGMSHDDTRCQCNGSACIMYSYASGSTLFSQCSGNDFESLILQGGGICLNNMPTNVISLPSCGNGIVESGEQCDCGTPQECTNKCCNPNTCQLTRGSTCAVGSCCSNCQVMVAGTPCRLSVDVCDLPEFCTGQSGSCPSDYYLMDGTPCQNYSAYCYDGRCQTYDFQCQYLFGNGAKKAADICFNVINANGDKFGNCGMQGSSYVKCSQANSMCGKVQCTNVNVNSPPPGGSVSIQVIQGASCVNADFNLGSDVRDPGYVHPGSSCAPAKTCINFQCVNATALAPNLTCNAQSTCNSNGVCNNLGNCYCNDGWAPPWCNKAGFGGSINGGPAQIDYSLRNGLLIFFLLVVPVLILIILALLYVFKRDLMKQCFRRRLPRLRTPANNNANGNLQRNATPGPQTQDPERPQQTTPRYPAPVLDPLPRYEEVNYGIRPDLERTTPKPAQNQGPGVPKPIPPRKDPPV